LRAFQFDISWDDSILTYNSDTVGPFIGSTGNAVFCSTVSETSSSFTYACNTVGAFTGPTGSGLLVSFRFDRASLGTTAITLSNGIVADSVSLSHSVNANGGSVTMQ
jgi:hypothetical protein